MPPDGYDRSFLDSAELYDSIYSFKDYLHECDKLRRLICKHVPHAKTVLDVACGTGEHARLLRSDYSIDGVDINETYLRSAQLKNPGSRFSRADMTKFNLGRTYDVVTCLFSAIGIVRTYEQLERAIFCMARHVTPGGVLIIEPWFTPERWRPGEPFILVGELDGEKIYRLSLNRREGLRSVLFHHYIRGISYGVERHDERIELSLFTRDEMTWAYEFSGMDVSYESEGLMGRGLYIGKHSADDRTLRELE